MRRTTPVDGAGDALASPSQVRVVNTARIVALVRDGGPLSRAELVRASGLARPTVMAIVSSLVAAGVLVESGTQRARDVPAHRGGRPGVLLTFNGAATTAVAAHLWSGNLALRQVAADGALLADVVLPTSTWDFGTLLDLLVREVRRLTGPTGSLGALSVTVSGFIDRGTVTLPAHGWDRVPVQEEVQARLGVPVTLLGPPTAAVVGEVASGAARARGDVVLIFLARGIGAGVVTGGRLLRGAGGAIGELGHCPVGSGLPCACGRRGCLETVAAGWAVREQVARLGLPVAPGSSLTDLAALRDPRVDAVLAGAAAALGSAAAWLVNLLNPSTVVLADTGFTRGAERFFASFRAAVLEHALDPRGPEVVQGTEGAVVRGAAHAALEHLPVPVRPPLHLGS
ncbi:ROK family protein [Kineococcus arenarius]|uniref:ROK family protein n=1 Tax=unclassified Kineococcus TaxID=2621656 RepID=UPI003D7D7105